MAYNPMKRETVQRSKFDVEALVYALPMFSIIIHDYFYSLNNRKHTQCITLRFRIKFKALKYVGVWMCVCVGGVIISKCTHMKKM